MRVACLVRRFLAFLDQTAVPRTRAFYALELEKLLRRAGRAQAGDLAPAQLGPLASKRPFVAAVKRMFHWALVNNMIVELPPCCRLRLPRTKGRQRILSAWELVRLLRLANPDFRALLLFLRESGARPQEARQVCWENLFPQDGWKGLCRALKAGQAFFLLTTHKALTLGARRMGARIIPVTPRVGRLLVRLASTERRNGPILLTKSGLPWTKEKLRNRMRRLRAKAGLNVAGSCENVVCYTLRHTAATRWAARGMSSQVLAGLLGHNSPDTTARYLHLTPAELLVSFEKVWEK